ncbi:hypothetical protein HPB50_023132 [Hyalomma asiaticum]|uniref:Uncharacterized protein n=1 Tax=Hyalomma asiaticum TaxID=266040 RepID=A0ACB7TKT9_HYAAI|nr:hypothetical protein HPB50_023132 [Hyalomma asiaticum]
MYREEEQGPKTTAELVSIYGYDIRTETLPPRARRQRHCAYSSSKYQCNWEDEEACTPCSGSGHGGVHGGQRTRGGSPIENPPFHDEDFPDFNLKPTNSENLVTVQEDWTPGSSSSHQEEWDQTIKGSRMTNRGCGKHPTQPPSRIQDALPRRQDSDVKENASLAHGISRPAVETFVKPNEAPHNLPSTGRSQDLCQLLTEHEQSEKDFEALEKLASKGELEDVGSFADRLPSFKARPADITLHSFIRHSTMAAEIYPANPSLSSLKTTPRDRREA